MGELPSFPLTPSKSFHLPSPPLLHPEIWLMMGPSGLGQKEGTGGTEPLLSTQWKDVPRGSVSGLGGTQAQGEGGGQVRGNRAGRGGGSVLGTLCRESPEILVLEPGPQTEPLLPASPLLLRPTLTIWGGGSCLPKPKGPVPSPG